MNGTILSVNIPVDTPAWKIAVSSSISLMLHNCFKDDYTLQFYSRGQSSLIFVGELHDTNLSTFFS